MITMYCQERELALEHKQRMLGFVEDSRKVVRESPEIGRNTHELCLMGMNLKRVGQEFAWVLIHFLCGRNVKAQNTIYVKFPVTKMLLTSSNFVQNQFFF